MIMSEVDSSAVAAGALEEGGTMMEHLGAVPESGAASKGRSQTTIILEEHEDATEDQSQAQQQHGMLLFHRFDICGTIVLKMRKKE